MLAGLLHDIGKLGLPDELLSKPFNMLTADQRAQVMKHPQIGQNLLMAIDRFKDVATLVRHHHECFDGTGYPERLAGMAIPLGARILAGLGINDLSMSAQDIAAVKTVLRAETLSAMQLLAQRALAAGSASEVRAL